jgi:SAM-dependent methyltransferase
VVLLQADKLAAAIARNQAHHLGISALLRRLLARRERGGARWVSQPIDRSVDHVLDIFHLLFDHVGDVAGKVGIEIGPGDNLGVAYCFLKDDVNGLFEEARLDEEVDFIYSNDVMEHVADVDAVFRAAHRLLRPGGVFLNNIDLAGHNAFSNQDRPLDFLTCPDPLWSLMFSHIVTTNRVRFSGFLAAATGAGFRIKEVIPLAKADPAYLRAVRPHLLPRYQALADDDLEMLQCLLVVQK